MNKENAVEDSNKTPENEEPQSITYKQLVELMFSHFEERDNLKADFLEANSDQDKQQKLHRIQLLDDSLASMLSSIQQVPIVDMFVAMILALESYRLLLNAGLKQSPAMIYVGAQHVEASIRNELESQLGKRFNNTRLELLLNASDGKMAAQQQHVQGQGKIILASR